MLDKFEIISFLKENKDLIYEKYGVVSIALIGSYARNEQNENSDIDFLVEFNEVSYSNLAGLSIFLEKNLGKMTDIIIKSPYLRKKFLSVVEKEAVYA